jgi:hypothetical protein
MVASCGVKDPKTETQGSASPDASTSSLCEAKPHDVRYSMDWDWGTAIPTSTGTGWEVINNLGFRIVVEKAYLVTYRTGLVACEEADLVDPQRDNPHQMCTASSWSWSLIPNAYAGHSFVDDDPVVITTSYVEDLSNPKLTDLGIVTVGGQTYCRVHYLLARAEREAVGLPEDVALVDSTIYLQGRYFAPDSNEAVAFTILDASADGALVDIEGDQAIAPPSLSLINVDYEGAQLRLIRNLGFMWDEVNFVSMSPRDIARRVLGNLTSTLKLEILRSP